MTQKTAPYLKQAIKTLRDAGFDGIDLFAPRKVPLSDSQYTIRQRCPEQAHEACLFATAIESVGRSFIKDIDFVLLMRADVLLWRHAKLLMEHTIEPNFFSVYFPLSPFPFFVDQERHLPCRNKLGWCEVRVDEPVSGAPCVAVNKHTAALLSGWVSDAKSDAKNRFGWEYHLSVIVQDLDITCYAASKSLAWMQNASEQDLADRVPPEARLREGFEVNNLYLN